MDWSEYPSLYLLDKDGGTNTPPFTDINFPHTPRHTNFLLDPPSPLASAASDPLSPSHLSTFDLPPSWVNGISPPSPTASTSSFSSFAWSTSSSDYSTQPSTPHPASATTPDTAPTPTQTPPLPATLVASRTVTPPREQGHLSSTTSTATAQTTTMKQPRKRTMTALTSQQRAEQKRRKHREIDALRIQREKSALQHLTHLTAPHDDNTDEPPEEGRRDKVRVLEDSARKIEELQRLVARLSDACTAQQFNDRSLVLQLHSATQQPHTASSHATSASSASSSHALSLVPSSVAKRLDAAVGSASLHASWFVSSSASMCVMRCATGCVLDVNDRLLRDSGWQRSHIVGRLMAPPYDYITAPHTYTEPQFRALSAQRTLTRGPGGRLVPADTQRQYERSRELIRDLYKGTRQSIECVFRTQLLDGRVYEVNSIIWTNSWVDEPCTDSTAGSGSGATRRRPDVVFMVASYADALCLDDAPRSGG